MIPSRPARRIQKIAPPTAPLFQSLWTMLMDAAEKNKNERFKAILANHSNRHEYICRKLGVVCAADVARITKKLQKPIGAINP
jgi:hypothetical protein